MEAAPTLTVDDAGALTLGGKAVDLLTPAQVAEIFRVDAKTVSRWATSGLLSYTRTVGGQRRFFRHEVEAHVQSGSVVNHE